MKEHAPKKEIFPMRFKGGPGGIGMHNAGECDEARSEGKGGPGSARIAHNRFAGDLRSPGSTARGKETRARHVLLPVWPTSEDS